MIYFSNSLHIVFSECCSFVKNLSFLLYIASDTETVVICLMLVIFFLTTREEAWYDFYVSHGSAARFGEKNYIYSVDNLLLFLTVKEFSKWVNSWWSYRKNSTPRFFETRCSLLHTTIAHVCRGQELRRYRVASNVVDALIDLLSFISLWMIITNNNNNIRLLQIDKPQLNTEMQKVKVIHT